jgi:hypothetical protein
MSIRTDSVSASSAINPTIVVPKGYVTARDVLKQLADAKSQLFGGSQPAFRELGQNKFYAAGYYYEFAPDFRSAHVFPDGVGESFDLDLRGDLRYQLNKHAVTEMVHSVCMAQQYKLMQMFPEGQWAVHGPNTRPNGEIAFRIAGPGVVDPSTNTQVIYNPQTGTVRTITRDGQVWPKPGQVRSAGTPGDALKSLEERFDVIQGNARASDSFGA